MSNNAKASLFSNSGGGATSASASTSGGSKTAGMTTKGLTSSMNNTAAVGAGLSAAAKAKKLEEARETSENGMKFLRTSVFKWAPDHLGAAPNFEASSNLYKAAGDYENARLMMLQAAISHNGYGAHAAAAISLLNASKLAQVRWSF